MGRRSAARGRRLGALALLATAGALAALPFAQLASAASTSQHRSTTSTTLPPPSGSWRGVPPAYPPFDRHDSGMPNSTIRIFNKYGQLAVYGNRSVLYVLPQYLEPDIPVRLLIANGEQLYRANCQACHGVDANGVPPQGTPGQGGFPSLQAVGPAAIDFWIESGRMPATSTRLTPPARRPARLDHLQAIEIAAWITSRWPITPYIPKVNLAGADLAAGAALFSADCAACHTITGDGDALANSTFAPSLRDIPLMQVAEALRTGPANMPVFTGNLTDAQMKDVVAYVVRKIEHPQNPGGVGLGGLGPVGEGFVGLALGVGLLALIGFWIGDRS